AVWGAGRPGCGLVVRHPADHLVLELGELAEDVTAVVVALPQNRDRLGAHLLRAAAAGARGDDRDAVEVVRAIEDGADGVAAGVILRDDRGLVPDRRVDGDFRPGLGRARGHGQVLQDDEVPARGAALE